MPATELKKPNILNGGLAAIRHETSLTPNVAEALVTNLLLEAEHWDGNNPQHMTVLRRSTTVLKSLAFSPDFISSTNTPLVHALVAGAYLENAVTAMGTDFRGVMMTVRFRKGDTLENFVADLRRLFDEHGYPFPHFATQEFVRPAKTSEKKMGRPKNNEKYGHGHIDMPWPLSRGGAAKLHSALVAYLAPRNEPMSKGRLKKLGHGRLMFYVGQSLAVHVSKIKDTKYNGTTGRRRYKGAIDYAAKEQPLHPDWPMLISDDLRQAADREIEAMIRAWDRVAPPQPNAIYIGSVEEARLFNRDAAELVGRVRAVLDRFKGLKRAAVRHVMAEWREALGIMSRLAPV